MTSSKRILITTETREIFIVRFNGKSNARRFCADCAAETEMLTIDAAAGLTGKSV